MNADQLLMSLGYVGTYLSHLDSLWAVKSMLGPAFSSIA
jgi:hypothetical protein